MKKVLSFVICMFVLFSLSACSSENISKVSDDLSQTSIPITDSGEITLGELSFTPSDKWVLTSYEENDGLKPIVMYSVNESVMLSVQYLTTYNDAHEVYQSDKLFSEVDNFKLIDNDPITGRSTYHYSFIEDKFYVETYAFDCYGGAGTIIVAYPSDVSFNTAPYMEQVISTLNFSHATETDGAESTDLKLMTPYDLSNSTKTLTVSNEKEEKLTLELVAATHVKDDFNNDYVMFSFYLDNQSSIDVTLDDSFMFIVQQDGVMLEQSDYLSWVDGIGNSSSDIITAGERDSVFVSYELISTVDDVAIGFGQNSYSGFLSEDIITQVYYFD